MDETLSQQQAEDFVRTGFVRIDRAFPRDVADACRAMLWRETGADPNDPATWTRPVVRLGQYHAPPFLAAANTPVLHGALDQIVGQGRWVPVRSMGTFPIRFPSDVDTGDTGWHIDASFAGVNSDAADFMTWRVNVQSQGRALLVLFLFSNVGSDDSPTRLRSGSHLAIARRLAGAGDEGLSIADLVANGFDQTDGLPEVFATGEPGTVYLCHPFLVHAAQRHRGSRPKFMAQQALFPAQPLQLERADGDYSAVERAIRLALGK